MEKFLKFFALSSFLVLIAITTYSEGTFEMSRIDLFFCLFYFDFFNEFTKNCLLLKGLKCYQCKEPDPRCRDPFQNDTAFFKTCPTNATKCRKYKWEGNVFVFNKASTM